MIKRDVRVQIEVTASELSANPSADRKAALGQQICALAGSVLSLMDAIPFVWRPVDVFLGFSDRECVDVKIVIYPADAFDPSRKKRIELLNWILELCRGFKGVSSPSTVIRVRVEVVRDALFGVEDESNRYVPKR